MSDEERTAVDTADSFHRKLLATAEGQTLSPLQSILEWCGVINRNGDGVKYYRVRFR